MHQDGSDQGAILSEPSKFRVSYRNKRPLVTVILRRGVWERATPLRKRNAGNKERRQESRLKKMVGKRNRIVTGEVNKKSAKEANDWLRNFREQR